ncbi:MAG: EAL domain-containing protein [Burkholderiaceae bacterium]
MDDGQGSTQANADRIRGDQIHAMESNVPKSLVGYLAAAAFAGVYAYPQWASLLLVWAPIVCVICAVRSVIALRTAMAAPRPMGIGHERFLMAATAIVSLACLACPIWIVLNSDGFTSAIMIALVISTTWGGAVVQATVMSSAVSFAVATIPVWLASLAVIDDVGTGQVQLALLVIVTTGVAIDNVKRFAKSFDAGLRQKIDLQDQSRRLRQQADVIGLLLKDHEDQSADWLWQVDVAGRITKPSARFVEVFGDGDGDLAGRCLVDLLRDDDTSGNAEAIDQLAQAFASGRPFRDIVIPGKRAERSCWWLLSGRPVLGDDGHVVGYRGVMGDVTEAKQAQAHVDYLAHHDPLTGLANRTHFSNRVQAGLAQQPNERVALISIDLDGFKPVNDRFGHPVGDALLASIARQLRQVVDSIGIVARLGGDEFAIAAYGLQTPQIERLCQQSIEAVCSPKRIGNHDVVVGASIGVAVAPADGDTVEELLKNADAALYRAKREGRGQFRFFEPEMDRQIQRRNLLLQDLRDAVQAGRLVLHYQPYVESASGRVTGCEALLRWNDPVRGAVSPAEFIPLAEESGLIVDIGRWVIDKACEAAAGWPSDIRVSVNVSPRQFKDRNLPAYIEDVVRRHALAPSRLEIEVTEAVLIDDAAVAMGVLRRIRGIGVKLSLDDFGTGYSSLSYLRDFPFDKVKIDRSFVMDIESRHDSQVIVQAIQSIAKGLGMTITAEGVETAVQARRLRSVGCHELQGFLFSKARPESELAGLLGHRLPIVADDPAADGQREQDPVAS